MATVVITNLAPGRTAVLQLYERGTNTTVGSAITGTSSGSTYSFAGVTSPADYDAILSGFTTPNGARFPIRDGIAYPGIPWTIVDATIYTPPVPAEPSTPNVCRVTIRSSKAGGELKTRVVIESGSTGRTLERAFVKVAANTETDAAGLLVVDLPWSSTVGVGKYRFRLIDIDSGEVLHDRSCWVPDSATANYEDLP